VNRRNFLKSLSLSVLAFLGRKPKLPWSDTAEITTHEVPTKGDSFVAGSRVHIYAPKQFDDVPNEFAWGRLINRLYSLGYVAGVGDNRFEPFRAITNAEMSVLLVRAKFGPHYQPPEMGDWQETWITEAVKHDLILPAWNPEGAVTRANVGTMMGLLV
jgi:hypothetical protein